MENRNKGHRITITVSDSELDALEDSLIVWNLSDILPRINSVGFLTVSRFVSTVGIIAPSVFIPTVYRRVCRDTHYSYTAALLQRDLEIPFHYVQRTICISVELFAV